MISEFRGFQAPCCLPVLCEPLRDLSLLLSLRVSLVGDFVDLVGDFFDLVGDFVDLVGDFCDLPVMDLMLVLL